MVVTRRRQAKSVTTTKHEENNVSVSKSKGSDTPKAKDSLSIKGRKEAKETSKTRRKGGLAECSELPNEENTKTEVPEVSMTDQEVEISSSTNQISKAEVTTPSGEELSKEPVIKRLKHDFKDNGSAESALNTTEISEVQLSEYSSDEEDDRGKKTIVHKTNKKQVSTEEIEQKQVNTNKKRTSTEKIKQNKVHNKKGLHAKQLEPEESTKHELNTHEQGESTMSRRSSRSRKKVKYVDSESEAENVAVNPKQNMPSASRRKDIDVSESCSDVSEKELESESASESASDSSLSSEAPQVKRQRMTSINRKKNVKSHSKIYQESQDYKKYSTRRVDLCEMDSDSVSSVVEKLKRRQFDGEIRYFLGTTSKDVQIDPDLLNKKVEKSKTMGECSKSTSSKSEEKKTEKTAEKKIGKHGDSSSESEWEEVSDAGEPLDIDNYNPEIPKEGVEISIGIPNKRKERRKNRQNQFVNYARQYLNRFKKETQVAMHKVHLLGYIAHMLYVNNILLDSTLQGVFLSILPDDFMGITVKKTTSILLSKMVTWFRNTFVLETKETNLTLTDNILNCLQTKIVTSNEIYCYMFIVFGRSMKLDIRLCKTSYPISFKTQDLIPTERQKQKVAKSKTEPGSVNKIPNSADNSKSEKTTCKSKTPAKKKRANHKNKSLSEQLTTDIPKASTSKEVEYDAVSNSESDSKSTTLSSSLTKIKPKESRSTTSSAKRNSRRLSKDVDIGDNIRGKRVKGKNVSYNEDESDGNSDSDVDFEPEVPIRTKRSTPSTTSKKNRKILSSDSENDAKKVNGKPCIDNWAEVYLNGEGKWVCVDVVKNIVNRPYEIEGNVSHQISYVLSVDNDSKVKDVTQRYASSWLTHIRKVRVDNDWWQESLSPFAPDPVKRELAENQQLEDMLLSKPMPTIIGEFKNHPLYVLKRHLLKYEALYPPDVPPLGFIRKEPVYARECVRILHSRESWKREGRAVKLGEDPYKLVKARPRWDKVNKQIYTPEEPLDVYGEWQTELWISPPCKDGKVPRNEYGNVELFKPSMLPEGAVHLQLSGLNRIARKLGIDCAPAMVGFDGSASVGIIPVFDGFIACKEHKEILIAAWDEEQVNIAKREQEKYEKRVYGNWRKLIRGLLIREKIKSKYFGSDKYGPKDQQNSEEN